MWIVGFDFRFFGVVCLEIGRRDVCSFVFVVRSLSIVFRISYIFVFLGYIVLRGVVSF